MLNFIIPFIILILVVVFIHEYGHYYFAKRYGVGVTDFSIGFGKEIFGWNDKSGTRWKICWIPLGGYVKFFGDRNVFSQADQEELLKKYNKEDQHKLFVTKPLYQRSLIVAGGPFANFVLAIFIFLFINMFVGKDFTPAVIDEVQKDSPAQIAGMLKNDVIIEIDNNEVESILEVSKLIMMSTSEYIDLKVLRYDQEILLKVKPNIVDRLIFKLLQSPYRDLDVWKLLKDLYGRVARLLNRAVGRKLSSVECCLLIDEAAVTIVAGNIRRSAGMRQFSSEDLSAAEAKDTTGVRSNVIANRVENIKRFIFSF